MDEPESSNEANNSPEITVRHERLIEGDEKPQNAASELEDNATDKSAPSEKVDKKTIEPSSDIAKTQSQESESTEKTGEQSKEAALVGELAKSSAKKPKEKPDNDKDLKIDKLIEDKTYFLPISHIGGSGTALYIFLIVVGMIIVAAGLVIIL